MKKKDMYRPIGEECYISLGSSQMKWALANIWNDVSWKIRGNDKNQIAPSDIKIVGKYYIYIEDKKFLYFDRHAHYASKREHLMAVFEVLEAFKRTVTHRFEPIFKHSK